MRYFSKTISYLFHPIFTPIIGSLLYFLVTPKFNEPTVYITNSLLPIFILTVLIPILSFLILKNLGIIKSVFIPDIKKRKYPFFINIILLFIVLLEVIPINYISEIHFFFIGLIIAYFTTLLLLFLNFKSSVHLMGISSILMFTTSLSVHFETNITSLISALILITGVIASTRIYLKAHSIAEVTIGLVIGLISQLLTLKFWL